MTNDKKSCLACCMGLTKSEWRLISKFSLLLGYRLQNHPANGKQGPVPEEKYQALLINKKQGNIATYTLTLSIQPSSKFPGRNMVYQ
jgi:hypothetical protein